MARAGARRQLRVGPHGQQVGFGGGARLSSEEHFRKLERMYGTAPCNQYYSPKLTISEGATELTIPVQEKFHHSTGAVHGSVYFKALDDAGFFAANSLVEDVFVLTTSFNIHLFRPVASGQLRAVGRVIQASKNVFVAEASLLAGEGEEIARGTGTYARGKVLLSPDIGYE
jgi:uncharacterized protein (TIGR00369 family)